MMIKNSTNQKFVSKSVKDILPADQLPPFMGAYVICLETGRYQLMQMVIGKRTWLFRFACRANDVLVQEAELTNPDTKYELIKLMELGVKNYERSQRQA